MADTTNTEVQPNVQPTTKVKLVGKPVPLSGGKPLPSGGKVKLVGTPEPIGGEEKKNTPTTQPTTSRYGAFIGRSIDRIGGPVDPDTDPHYLAGHHARTLDTVHGLLNAQDPKGVADYYDTQINDITARQGSNLIAPDPASMNSESYRAQLRERPFKTPEGKAENDKLEGEKQQLKQDKDYHLGLVTAKGDTTTAKQQGMEYLKFAHPNYYKENVGNPDSLNALHTSDYSQMLSMYQHTPEGKGATVLPLDWISKLAHPHPYPILPSVQMEAEQLGLQHNLDKADALYSKNVNWLNTTEAAIQAAKTPEERAALITQAQNSPQAKEIAEAKAISLANTQALKNLPAKYPEVTKQKQAMDAWQAEYNRMSGIHKTAYNLITSLALAARNTLEDVGATVNELGNKQEPGIELERDDQNQQTGDILSHWDVAHKGSGFQKAFRTTGSFIPTVLTIAATEGAGGALLGADLAEGASEADIAANTAKTALGANIGRAVGVGAITWGQSHNEAIESGLSPAEANKFAALSTALTFGVFSDNPPAKIMEKGFFRSVIRGMSKESLDKVGAKGLANAMGEALLGAGKAGAMVSVQTALNTGAEAIENSALHPGKGDPKLYQDFKSNLVMFGLSSIGMSLLGSAAAPRNAFGDMTVDALYQGATNPDTYTTKVAQDVAKGKMTQAKADKMIQTIQTVKKIHDGIPETDIQGNPLAESVKKAILANEYRKTLLQGKSDATNLEAAKKAYQDKISEIDNLNTHLIGGEPKGPVYAVNDLPATKAEVENEIAHGRTEGVTVQGDPDLQDKVNPKPTEQPTEPENTEPTKEDKIAAIHEEQDRLQSQINETDDEDKIAKLEQEKAFGEIRKSLINKYGLDYTEMVNKLRDEGKLKMDCPGKTAL